MNDLSCKAPHMVRFSKLALIAGVILVFGSPHASAAPLKYQTGDRSVAENGAALQPFPPCFATAMEVSSTSCAAAPKGDLTVVETAGPSKYSPSDLRLAYAIPQKGGAGQTVAVINSGGAPHVESDLAKFRSSYGMSACESTSGCFAVRGYRGNSGESAVPTEESEREASAAVEMVSVACEECHIILVEAPHEFIPSVEAVKTAYTVLGATEISISWGDPEPSSLAGYNKYFKPKTKVPIVAASGDSGYDNYLDKTTLAPNFPATIPWVVAVGGTVLEKDSSPRGWADTIWNNEAKNATGSGCSQQQKPVWQTLSGCGKRLTNDVSIAAEGLNVYLTHKTSLGTVSSWAEVGGTSSGAPLIAGLLAHATKRVREHADEAFYKDLKAGLGNVLDVVPHVGANNKNYSASCSSSYECEVMAGTDGHAINGYDGPTGVGVPQGIPTLKTAHKDTPSGSGTFNGVSCVTADSCMVVGGNAGAVRAEAWNGETWASQTVPSQPSATDELFDVSCPAANACIATGGYSLGEVSRGLLVERWDGSTWTRENPTASGYFEPQFWGVSCTSAVACTAVGNGDVGATLRPFALRWNGSEWKLQSVPLPSGAGETQLRGVACVSSTECYASGGYRTSGSHLQGIVEKWTEAGWEIIHTTGNESYLYGISCPSEGSCMVVGESEEQSLAETWDGSAWTVRRPPRPASEYSVLQSVSCATPDACTAVGLENYSEEAAVRDNWNGVAWESEPNPEGLGVADTDSVSCPDAGSCMAVGYYVSSGSGKPLVTRMEEDVTETPEPSTVAEVGATPTTVRDTSTKEQDVFFTDETGGIGAWEYSEENGWENFELAGAVRAGTSPAAATDSSTHGTVVFYVTSSGELAAWGHLGETWEPVSLGGSVRTGTSPTALVDESKGAYVAYYINTSGEVAYWGYTEETGWVNGTVGGAVKAATDLSATLDTSTGNEIIYYVNTGGELAAWVYTGTFTNITVGGEVRSGTSPATATNFGTSDVVVYYVNTSGEVAIKYYESGWKSATLGGAVRSGSTPTVVNDLATGGQTVDYLTTSNEIGYWYFAGSWSSGVLSGEPAASGGSPSLLRDGTTGDQWLYYVGEGGELWTWTALGETLSNGKVE